MFLKNNQAHVEGDIGD